MVRMVSAHKNTGTSAPVFGRQFDKEQVFSNRILIEQSDFWINTKVCFYYLSKITV